MSRPVFLLTHREHAAHPLTGAAVEWIKGLSA
jgi:hypothetical protein